MAFPTRSKMSRRDFLKLSGTLAASSLIAASCAPEQTPTAPPSQVEPQIPQVIPPQVMNVTAPLAVIALNRMGFGPRPGDFETFNALGATDEERLRAYVDQQLNPDLMDDSEFESRYTAAGFETLHKSHEQLYADHIANNPYNSNDDAHWEWYNKPAQELVDATFLRAVYSRKQLAEVLADFWHNHFNIFLWQDDGVPLLVSYNRDLLRKHMLGNFRQMLEAVAQHPSMLYYLNQNNSSDAAPMKISCVSYLNCTRSAQKTTLGCVTQIRWRKTRTEFQLAMWITMSMKRHAVSQAGLLTMTLASGKMASKKLVISFTINPGMTASIN
jgi:hypothetical protein